MGHRAWHPRKITKKTALFHNRPNASYDSSGPTPTAHYRWISRRGFSFVPEKEVSIAGPDNNLTSQNHFRNLLFRSSLFLTFTIITMSRWYLSNEKL
jgi:hypothetical protein